jgi:ubiquinone/menaquinone biosynthesis C-methylase UbiE
MSKRNIPRTQWTVDKSNIAPRHTVLEIGFGPGYGLKMAAARTTEGTVYGLDFSPSMVKMAARRNRAIVASGKIRLVEGDLSPAPFGDNFFDRIFAVNVVYFWREPRRELSEIRRILKRGGKAAFYISDRHSMDSIGCTNTGLFTKYTADEFWTVLSDCRFYRIYSETRTEVVQGVKFTGHCFVAEK